MRRLLKNILLISLALAGLFWILRRTGALPEWRNPFAARPITIDNTPLLVRNIQTIAQLMTIEYHDEVVVDSLRNTVGMLPLPPFVLPAKAKLVLIVKGRLVAGLDLSGFDSTRFGGNRDSLYIRLPRAKVLEVAVNPTDVEVFAESGTWNQAAVAALKAKAQYRITKNALAQGVLQRSDEKARALVAQLMANAGYKQVVVSSQ